MGLCRTLPLALSFAVAGCAIHPLPEDVTPYTTQDIVRRIRCETREALADKLVAWLRSQAADRAAQIAVSSYDAGTDISLLDLRGLKPSTSAFINYFGASAVAYDFTFNMTERNNFDGSLSLVHPFRTGTKSAVLGLDLDRARQNTSTFTVTDTFFDLVKKADPAYCYGRDTKSKNYIYPITGNIGIGKTIDKFVDLSIFGNLAKPAGKDGPPTMTEALEFTTTVVASATPTLGYDPVRFVTRVASASLVANSSRDDKHKVILAFSRPDPKNFRASNLFTGGLVNVSAGSTPAEDRAALAIQQYIIRFEVNRSTAVVLDRNSFLPF